jgi:UDP-3-O-[3-hydroxymyristoyl] N-acetylglucosamine deacetylase
MLESPPVISSSQYQRTIAAPTQVHGFGYWRGEDVTVEFRPAPADGGIVFVRTDGASPLSISAIVENRIEIPRRTVLRQHGVSVEMVEHLLAALRGLGVDNCEVHVNRPEIPGLDGSSFPFVEAIQSVGIQRQCLPRRYLKVTSPLRIADNHSWVEAYPSDRLQLEYHLDYPDDRHIGQQSLVLDIDESSFCQELATARTFLTSDEAEEMRRQGIGNRVTPRDLLIFGSEGPLENELRFPDECVRHKTLDLLGDLALAGLPILGRFVAYRSGHRQNALMVRALLSQAAQHKSCSTSYRQTA